MEGSISEADFSPDSKFLFTRGDRYEGKVWEIATGRPLKLLKDEEYFQEVKFSPDRKFLFTRNDKDKGKVWEIATGRPPNFLKEEEFIRSAKFSPDSKFIFTRNAKYEGKFWEIATGLPPKFLKDEKAIGMVTFSPDSKFLFTKNDKKEGKVWEMASGKISDFLQGEGMITDAKFSQDSKYLTIITNHKIKTFDLSNDLSKDTLSQQTLWVNKKPRQVEIIENCYLYAVVGKAIIKMDLQEQRGNFFSYGDGEPLDYTYEEIEEWIKDCGDKYLRPLDDEIKEKYGIKDEKPKVSLPKNKVTHVTNHR